MGWVGLMPLSKHFSDEGVRTEMFVAELLEITVVIYVCRVEVL